MNIYNRLSLTYSVLNSSNRSTRHKLRILHELNHSYTLKLLYKLLNPKSVGKVKISTKIVMKGSSSNGAKSTIDLFVVLSVCYV